MTDEGRQKLCSSLRDLGDDPFTFQVEMLMEQAADEIERLVKELEREKLLRLSERYPDVPCDQLAKQIND